MIWRLLLVAEQRFRKLAARELCLAVWDGAVNQDGRRPTAITPLDQRIRAARRLVCTVSMILQ